MTTHLQDSMLICTCRMDSVQQGKQLDCCALYLDWWESSRGLLASSQDWLVSTLSPQNPAVRLIMLQSWVDQQSFLLDVTQHAFVPRPCSRRTLRMYHEGIMQLMKQEQIKES